MFIFYRGITNHQKEKERETKMKNKKGFTLIEMVVVLAVIAILSAILAPTLTRYIESARIHRAQNDVKVIASAIAVFNSDVGEWPIWKSGSAMQSASSAVNMLAGPGTTPAASDTTNWVGALALIAGGDSTKVSLSGQLNANTPGYPITGNGRRQWKGPYLSTASGAQEIGTDPWGNRYLVVVKSLQPGAAATASYALSAGPNEMIETAFGLTLGAGAAPGPGGDDIICFIR